jgi:hypothetical protein
MMDAKGESLGKNFNDNTIFHDVIGLLRTKHQYSIEKPQEKYSTP